MRSSHIRFIRQQGFPVAAFSDRLYSALMLQPRLVGVATVIGVLLQSPSVFLALSAALWLGALVPARNPFDALYNNLVAYSRGLPPLDVAPAPRRFAAGEAALFALATAVALFAKAATAAWVLEGILIGGVLSAVAARFCIGAYTYHLLRRCLPGRRPDVFRQAHG